jgi:hypothetical protein
MTRSMSAAMGGASRSVASSSPPARSIPVASNAPTNEPADVPMITSAVPRSTPASRSPTITPHSHAMPVTPPPPSTSALPIRETSVRPRGHATTTPRRAGRPNDARRGVRVHRQCERDFHTGVLLGRDGACARALVRAVGGPPPRRRTVQPSPPPKWGEGNTAATRRRDDATTRRRDDATTRRRDDATTRRRDDATTRRRDDARFPMARFPMALFLIALPPFGGRARGHTERRRGGGPPTARAGASMSPARRHGRDRPWPFVGIDRTHP